MNRKYLNRLSNRPKVDRDYSPDSALIISGQENPQTRKRLTSFSNSLTSGESPLPNSHLSPDNVSNLSFKTPEHGPLTEVTSLSPTEIKPSQCEKSSNPSVNYFFERAFASSESQEFQTAIKLYKKVLACDHNHFESLINIGVCMMKMGMLNEASTSYDSAIKANKTSFIPYYNKALSFISVQDYSSALQCMNSANLTLIDPPPELQKIRTFAIFKSGKVSSAISSNDGKESPVSPKLDQRTFSPTEELITDRPKDCKRRMSLPCEHLGERKLCPEKTLITQPWKIKEIKDFDTRETRTNLSVTFSTTQANDLSPPMSPVRGSYVPKKNSSVYDWRKFMPQEFFKPKNQFPVKVLELDKSDKNVKDQVVAKKIREKLNGMEDKIIEFIVKKIQRFFTTPGDIGRSQMTKGEIGRVMELFVKEERNNKKIDDFFKDFEFFDGLNEEFRLRLMETAKVRRIEKGSMLFGQGEVGDLVYVLLKGKLAISLDSEKQETASVTDYLKFSRYLSMQKRLTISLEYLSNCSAEEESYLLAFPTSDYQIILSDMLKSEIEDKVCFLISLPLFKGVDPFLLIPLAWHSEKEIFKEGDIIIKKNSLPKGLVIIYSGYCGIYTTGVSHHKAKASEYANIKKRSPRPPTFYTGNPVNSFLNRPFHTKSKSNAPDSKKPYEKIDHGLLRYGDYFGGRVVLEHNLEELGSKFSIVAESKEVELIIVTKATMQLLQEKLVAHLKVVLQKTHDVDYPEDVNSEELDSMFNNWQKYKKNFIDVIQRRKFVEAKKIEFPYLR